MADRFKLNTIVELLKINECELDTEEVSSNLYGTLSQLGFGDIELSDEEYYLLVDELLPIAEQCEYNEVQHQVFHDRHREQSGLML